MKSYKHQIQRFIEEQQLFTPADKILVALSGGADSVALLRVLIEGGYTCECAHCNFHLRGKESDRDEAFVRSLCQSLEIPLHVIHFDTKAYATEKHISIEMAARELRYEWFEKVRTEIGATVIAVAHHRDDNVETFLLNLIRGTGINGLKGIRPKNGCIVRPLLSTSRAAILDYLAHLNQEYVTDSTNLQDEYLRNKIRLNLLPLMQSVNPSIAESIDETAGRLAEVAAIYHRDRTSVLKQKVEKMENHVQRISIQDITDDVAPLSLIHEWLSSKGFNATQIKDIYHCLKQEQSGKRFLSLEWELLRDREYLVLQPKDSIDETPELSIELIEITSDFHLPKDKHIACLDADKVVHPLIIRKWQKGDKFIPFGMKGKKMISDYLTDRKFSLFEKERQYVVCSEDKIVWLINERIDDRFKITNESKKALLLRVK